MPTHTLTYPRYINTHTHTHTHTGSVCSSDWTASTNKKVVPCVDAVVATTYKINTLYSELHVNNTKRIQFLPYKKHNGLPLQSPQSWYLLWKLSLLMLRGYRTNTRTQWETYRILALNRVVYAVTIPYERLMVYIPFFLSLFFILFNTQGKCVDGSRMV